MLVWSPENQYGDKMSEGAISHKHNKEYDSGKHTHLNPSLFLDIDETGFLSFILNSIKFWQKFHNCSCGCF